MITEGRTHPDPNITLPWYFKLTWVLQVLSYPGLALSFLLPLAVVDGVPNQNSTSPAIIHIHGLGQLFVLVDIIMIVSPYRLQHAVYPMLVALVYYAWTGIYYLAGGTNQHHHNKEIDGDTYVYKEKVDWGRFPITTTFLLLLSVFVGAPQLHLFIYLIFKIKEVFVEWYYFNQQKTNK